LAEREQVLRDIVGGVRAEFPGVAISVEVKESYRNMGYKIAEDPVVLDVAEEAARRVGIEPVRRAIRGGTDGARLSYAGLLTPNVWAGGQNFHSVHEWVSLEWMAKASETALAILAVWLERSGGR
jgi:tripeptide aminopeptidase